PQHRARRRRGQHPHRRAARRRGLAVAEVGVERARVAVAVACGLVAVAVVPPWAVYVVGNGLTVGAAALGSLALLFAALAAAAAGVRRGVLVAVALFAAALVFAVVRITAVDPLGTYAYCVDGDCGAHVPRPAALIREGESARAGAVLAHLIGI